MIAPNEWFFTGRKLENNILRLRAHDHPLIVGGADAYISKSGAYRYWLTRNLDSEWIDPTNPGSNIVFVMLNPSTANANEDDATIRRCMFFGRQFNASRLIVVNLFAYRSTDPEGLEYTNDPAGPLNNVVLRTVFSIADQVVYAWGTHKKLDLSPTAAFVQGIGAGTKIQPKCLKINKDGSPGHPLYLKNSTPLRDYSPLRLV